LSLTPAGTGEMHDGFDSTGIYSLSQSRCGSSACTGCGR
jgi:hypothetical protein